jgi:hypothetical protein
MLAGSHQLTGSHHQQAQEQPPYRPVYARQTGARAAIGMGGSATLILLIACFLTGQPHETQAVQESQISRTTTLAKFTTKASMTDPEPIAMAPMKPFAKFDLTPPGFELEKKTLASRETRDENGRIDSLTIGQFGMGAPFLNIDIHQGLGEKEATPDFYLDLSRHAAQLGLSVTRISQPALHQTRLGAFEIADIRLVQPTGEGVMGGSERACLAARLTDPRLKLEIAGLICNPSASKPLARATLACALDHLDYAPTGDDSGFKEFFNKPLASQAALCPGAISQDDVTASIPARKSRGGRKAQQR